MTGFPPGIPGPRPRPSRRRCRCCWCRRSSTRSTSSRARTCSNARLVRGRRALDAGAELRPVELELARAMRESIRQLLESGDGDLGPLREVAGARAATLAVGQRQGRWRSHPPGHRRSDRRPVSAPAHRAHRPGGRHLVTFAGVRQRRVPLGLLRPLQEQAGTLVQHGRVREPAQEPGAAGPTTRRIANAVVSSAWPHTLRSAAAGARRAARIAGYRPARAPSASATATPPATASTGTTTIHPWLEA